MSPRTAFQNKLTETGTLSTSGYEDFFEYALFRLSHEPFGTECIDEVLGITICQINYFVAIIIKPFMPTVSLR